jgi:putative transposase
VINRGNARAEVFHAEGDYQAFVTLLAQASQRIPMRLLAYCLSRIISISRFGHTTMAT